MSEQLTTWQINQIPAEFINEVALGVEDPVDVAFRYGFSASQFGRLKEFAPFVNAVGKRKTELETSGFTAKTKAVLMADPLMDKAFRLAMADGASLGQVLDVLKTMTRLGDIEPRGVATGQASGPAFSIQINLPNFVPSAKTEVIDQKLTLNLPTFTHEDAEEVPEDGSRRSDPVADAG